MTDALAEAVARAMNPVLWDDDLPVPTRGHIVAFHEARQKSCADATAALQAIEAAGYRVVPVEATFLMTDRGYEALCDGDGTVADASDCWSAMLSAAPRVFNSDNVKENINV